MIKIIRGVYGHREGTRIVPKTTDSEPFCTSPEQEKRLVGMGVAKYIDAPKEAIVNDIEEFNEFGLPVYDDTTKFDRLKEIAPLYGVDASNSKSKKEIVALLDEAYVNMKAELAGEGEELPDLTPQEVV